MFKRVVIAASKRGKHVTDDEAREALAREYNDFAVAVFNPTTPAPDVPRTAIDAAAEFLMKDLT